jgi:hypothetical protein
MGSRERNRWFRSLGPQAEVISRDLEDGDQCADRERQDMAKKNPPLFIPVKVG